MRCEPSKERCVLWTPSLRGMLQVCVRSEGCSAWIEITDTLDFEWRQVVVDSVQN